MSKIILASKSPRRIDLLRSLNLDFEVQPSEFEELAPNLPPDQHVLENAKGKAEDIARKNPNSIIIGVDTIGSINNHILEKPIDEDDAFRIVKLISGRTHEVYSGICLIDTTHGKEQTAIEVTEVRFAPMTNEQIMAYVKTGEAMDKAAAFAIQGLGALFVEGINGCYYNVMGLPIHRLGQMLAEFGYRIL